MGNTKIAAAVGAGYLLGRLHKARWALALGGLAAGKRLSSGGGSLMSSLLDSSPQLRELAGTVRGELADAGRKAAITAAGNRMESLTEQLQRRTESLQGSGKPRGAADDEGEEPEEEPEEEENEEPESQSQQRKTAPPSRAPRKTASSERSSRAPAKKSAARKPASTAGTAKKSSSSPSRGTAAGSKPSGTRSTGRGRR